MDPVLSIKILYEDFIEKNGRLCSYQTYQRTFQRENIRFSKPNVDECTVCLEYKDHLATASQAFTEGNLTAGDSEQHDVVDCEVCKVQEHHKRKYTDAREEYPRLISDPNHVCFTADMQKVLVLPVLTTKEHLFVSMLIVFNETFASKQQVFQIF